jgi:YggT family protein
MSVVVALLNLYTFVLLARAISSWIPVSYDSPFRPVVDFLYRVTEPVLAPVRQVLPPIGGLDLSFIVVFIAIRVVVGLLT